MKKLVSALSLLLALCLLLPSCGFLNKNETEYYELVSETQTLLDEFADDIYSCWYDFVYEEEYDSVDDAILAAMLINSDNIDVIEANNEEIKELYKKVKDGKLESEVKDVMGAYNDYYAFVMEVSGSFNSFSESKEKLKKELSSALKDLEVELD